MGLWIDAGSRFETEKNNGVAHFLEHMAFKVCPSFLPFLLRSNLQPVSFLSPLSCFLLLFLWIDIFEETN